MIGRSAQSHGAKTTMAGVISNGATWYETIELRDEDGNPLTGYGSDTWALTIRETGDDDSAVLTVTPTYTEGADETTLLINVPQTSIASLEGDYIGDLKSTAASNGRIEHWAHGVVTFRNDP